MVLLTNSYSFTHSEYKHRAYLNARFMILEGLDNLKPSEARELQSLKERLDGAEKRLLTNEEVATFLKREQQPKPPSRRSAQTQKFLYFFNR